MRDKYYKKIDSLSGSYELEEKEHRRQADARSFRIPVINGQRRSTAIASSVEVVLCLATLRVVLRSNKLAEWSKVLNFLVCQK